MEPIAVGLAAELVDFARPTPGRGSPVTPAEISPKMKAVIEDRVQAILDAHANNLIEGIDVGSDWLEATLELARLPINNEEFSTRADATAWSAPTACHEAPPKSHDTGATSTLTSKFMRQMA